VTDEIASELKELRRTADHARRIDCAKVCFSMLSGYSAVIKSLINSLSANDFRDAPTLVTVTQLKELYGKQRAFLVGVGSLPAAALLALPPRATMFILSVHEEMQQMLDRLCNDKVLAVAVAVDNKKMAEMDAWLRSDEFDLAALCGRLQDGMISLEECWIMWTVHIDKLQALHDKLLHEHYTTVAVRKKYRRIAAYAFALFTALLVLLRFIFLGYASQILSQLFDSFNQLLLAMLAIAVGSAGGLAVWRKGLAPPVVQCGYVADDDKCTLTDELICTPGGASSPSSSPAGGSPTTSPNVSAGCSSMTPVTVLEAVPETAHAPGDGLQPRQASLREHAHADAADEEQEMPMTKLRSPGIVSLLEQQVEAWHAQQCEGMFGSSTSGHHMTSSDHEHADIFRFSSCETDTALHDTALLAPPQRQMSREPSKLQLAHDLRILNEVPFALRESQPEVQAECHSVAHNHKNDEGRHSSQLGEYVHTQMARGPFHRPAQVATTSTSQSSKGTASPSSSSSASRPSSCDPDIDKLQDLFNDPNGLDVFSKAKCLGRGSFGQALLMTSPSGDAVVAKRVLLEGIKPNELKRLETEVAVCAKLRHPNICHYLGTVLHSDALLICLEYAAGGTLCQRIEEAFLAGRPFGAAVARLWIAQIALAVSYTHSMQVLHRDLSAQNVFLSSCDQIKVGDFGLSKASESSLSVQGKTVCGTPTYFSPEMVNGEPYGPASDVWSIGLLAHEILTLRHPFMGVSMAVLMQRIASGDYDEQLLADAPYPEEIKVVASAKGFLHADPKQRLTLKELLAQPMFALN